MAVGVKALVSNDLKLLPLERAAADVRRGIPVVVRDGDVALLVMALDRADEVTVSNFDQVAHQHGADTSQILITNQRAMGLKVAGKGWPVVGLVRSSWLTPSDMVAIADPSLDLSNPLMGPFKRVEDAATNVRKAAIKLVKWAQLLPAALICLLDGAAPAHTLEVEAETVLSADTAHANTLQQVAAANVPLEGSENTRLVAFRPLSGGLEHIAIVVGDPPRGEPALVRIHSECFTGDLLASMKCDCGEQLRGAIKHMADAGGGVVLYLAQEGRGIGLISKLKAYSLQDQGYDTVDANTKLGFEVDERVFAPAAEMLKGLGFKAVRLMTNNPNKVEGLSALGIEVTERVQHTFPPNPHNINYLNTKKTRTGHLL